MSRTTLVLLFITLHTCLALYGNDDAVTILTSENFDKFISYPGVTVVKFYASWCTHCESFAPKFKKAAQLLEGVVQFGTVDSENQRDIGGRFNIEAYPTVLVFRGDKSPSSPIKYSGSREVEEVTKFLVENVHEMVAKRGKSQGFNFDFCSNKRASSGGSCGAGGSNKHGGRQNANDKNDDHHQGSGSVITLTDSNFDKLVLESEDVWLVSFYAPWCGHCQRLAPEWSKAAEQLKGQVKVGQVDATVEKNLAQRYGIQGFPTIKYFKNGIAEDYSGGRSASDIVAFGIDKAALNMPPPDVHEITSNEVLHEACGQKLCVIGFLPHLMDCQSKCREDYISLMKQAAEKNKAKGWGWLWSTARTHKDLEDSLQVGGFGYPTMVVINLRKEKSSVMRGSFTPEGIREFLHELMVGGGSITLNPITSLPEVTTSVAWDGEDAQIVEEDEIDLSELGIKSEL